MPKKISIELYQTFLVKGLSFFGFFLLSIYISRRFGISSLGEFALLQGIVQGFGLISTYGSINSIMFIGGKYSYKKKTFILLLASIFLTILISFSISSVLIYFSKNIDSLLNLSPGNKIPIYSALILPIYSILLVLSGYFKGIRKAAFGCLMENGNSSLITLILCFLFEKSNLQYDFKVCLSINAIAYLITLAIGVFLIRKFAFKNLVYSLIYLRHSLLNTFRISNYIGLLNSYFIISLSLVLQQHLLFVVIGALLDPEKIGLLKSVERIGFLQSYVLIVINSVFPSRFSRLYAQQKKDQLESLAQTSSLIGCVFSLPLFICCIASPSTLLQLFGDQFTQGANLLRIYSLAQLVNVSTGSANFLLSMTRHENIVRNISIYCSVLSILITLLSTYFFGIWGSIISISFVLMLRNLIAFFYVRKKLGFYMLNPHRILFLINKVVSFK